MAHERKLDAHCCENAFDADWTSVACREKPHKSRPKSRDTGPLDSAGGLITQSRRRSSLCVNPSVTGRSCSGHRGAIRIRKRVWSFRRGWGPVTRHIFLMIKDLYNLQVDALWQKMQRQTTRMWHWVQMLPLINFHIEIL